MDKKIIKNYLYNILFQIVKMSVPLILVPYTIKHLSFSMLGINDYAGTIATYFIMLGSLGVNIYGNREIARKRNDKDKLSTTFFEILSMQIINTIIALVFYLSYVTLFVKANREVFYLFSIMIVASAIDITWFFQGIENFKTISLRNIIVKITGMFLIFLFVKKPDDIYIFILINSVTELLSCFVLFLSLKKYIYFKIINIKDVYQNHFKNSFDLFIPTVAISVYTMLDQTMLGYLIDDKSYVSIYKTSQGFVKIFLYFITSIGQVILPRISNIISNDKDSDEKVLSFLNITTKVALFLSLPLTFGLVSLSPSFISWYIPNEPKIISVIQVTSFIIVLISLSNVCGIQYLIPSGNNKAYTNSVVGGAIVNFVLNLFFIQKYYALGACIATVIAETVVTSIQYIYLRKKIKLEFFTFNNFKYLIASLIMAIVVYFIGIKLEQNIITNIVQIISGFIIYIIILISLKEELIKLIFKKILFRKG